MAYKLTDFGVDVTKGRGRSKTVVLSISYKELEKWAKANRIDTKRLMDVSFGRAAAGLKQKFYKVMKSAGGVEGVPKFKSFEEFTTELRKADDNTAPMGGILAERSRIVAFKRNGWQVIGWPDRLAEWALKFQDGGDAKAEQQLNDNSWRHWIHRKGIREIPRTYAHNPRQVLPEPFGGYVRKNLDEWARGSFYKSLAKQMAKARGV